ncbi:cell division protein FtsK [Streptomyces yunnanensis]|uniref:DNA segregation ATPase FtsK/SpoIIIE, S-DNA-T family n=1 Tax=Streptomyces yunnanensis TaxID=156453 RepID=A0A9X8MSA4_9ACTN|nr:cell division protein FtsK [Streptomyces yunnanensis]SHL61058.1 DNA segregation ATPase FtsK/SpoIIIE, S-DNA-T family [Streptomyces yunnanensis]
MPDLHHVTTIALGLSGAVLAALALIALFRLVRFIRADRPTRTNLRTASRIRRNWRHLASALSLEATDRIPTTMAQLTTKTGQKPEPRTLTPSLRTRVDAAGVTVFMNTVPGVGLEKVTAVTDDLANAWECARVSVSQERPGLLKLRAVRTDPLGETTHYVPDGTAPAELTVWPLGVDEYGDSVPVALSNVPGVCVAGLPGYGKTSLINAFIARYAPSDAVQFAVADGKASTPAQGDYADAAGRLFAFTGDDLEDANKLFARLVQLRCDRMDHIRAETGSGNFWETGPSRSWPLAVLIIDEAQTFFQQPKGNDPKTKRLAALAAENVRLVEDLVKKGRSVGIVTILATQKPTGDAIPTAIRDVCPVGLSFAQRTAEGAVAALGDDIRKAKDADPCTLQDPAYVGVASMRTPGRSGFTRVRTPLTTSEDTARVTAASAYLTADPATLLPRGEGPDPADFTKAA